MPPLRTPWTTLVGNGLLRFMIHGQERRMTLFGGIVEVRIGRVAILARESEVVDHLDIDAIRAVNQMAQRVLLEARTELGLMNAEVALERSLVCVEAVNLNALFGGPQPPRCAKYGCDICQGC